MRATGTRTSGRLHALRQRRMVRNLGVLWILATGLDSAASLIERCADLGPRAARSLKTTVVAAGPYLLMVAVAIAWLTLAAIAAGLLTVVWLLYRAAQFEPTLGPGLVVRRSGLRARLAVRVAEARYVIEFGESAPRLRFPFLSALDLPQHPERHTPHSLHATQRMHAA